jgi:hemoglobin
MSTGESEPTFYERIGGETGVRALVDHFYDVMDTRTDVLPLRAMHPRDLTESRNKLFEFLSGWLGGPPLYMQRRGHPRLRARHMPFPIDTAARDQWMQCMEHALAQATLDDTARARLTSGFADLATHMINHA